MRPLPIAVLASLVLAVPALAADPPRPKFPWEGFGVGSSVQKKTTSKMEMSTPGMPAQPPNVSESRETLVKVTDEAWTVRRETKSGDSWVGAIDIPFPRKWDATPAAKDVPKPEDLGTEKVTIEGKDYECKKQKVVVAGSTVVSWTSEAHGVLKSETQAGGGMTSTNVVTSLAKKVTVGGKEVVAREEKSTAKTPQGTVTSVRLTSETVPGHEVRSESTSDMGMMKTSAVTEVVSFETK